MNELEYRPRASARSLVTGATGTLALVIPFFTHPSAVERMRGVIAALDETEYDLVVCNVASASQRDEYLGRGAPLDRSDGLLLVSLAPSDDEVDAFERAGAPVVVLDAFHPRLPCLRIDDVAGGVLATRHLIDLGHERIAFVGDRPEPGLGFVSSERRHDGYRRALQQAGIPIRRELQREGRTAGWWRTGSRAICSRCPSRRRRSSPPPTRRRSACSRPRASRASACPAISP